MLSPVIGSERCKEHIKKKKKEHIKPGPYLLGTSYLLVTRETKEKHQPA